MPADAAERPLPLQPWLAALALRCCMSLPSAALPHAPPPRSQGPPQRLMQLQQATPPLALQPGPSPGLPRRPTPRPRQIDRCRCYRQTPPRPSRAGCCCHCPRRLPRPGRSGCRRCRRRCPGGRASPGGPAARCCPGARSPGCRTSPNGARNPVTAPPAAKLVPCQGVEMKTFDSAPAAADSC